MLMHKSMTKTSTTNGAHILHIASYSLNDDKLLSLLTLMLVFGVS